MGSRARNNLCWVFERWRARRCHIKRPDNDDDDEDDDGGGDDTTTRTMTQRGCDVDVSGPTPLSVGESEHCFFRFLAFFSLFFFFRSLSERKKKKKEKKLHRQAHVTLQSQDPTFAMCIEGLIFTLAAIGRRSKGGRGPCVQVHGRAGEIRPALCTPRE